MSSEPQMYGSHEIFSAACWEQTNVCTDSARTFGEELCRNPMIVYGAAGLRQHEELALN
jgi:hypothetical protein